MEQQRKEFACRAPILIETMKECSPCSFLLCVLAVGHAFPARSNATDWGPPTNHLQMSIGLKGDETRISTNQPIKLLIRLRNLSTDETFHFYRANASERSPHFSFSLTAPSGKDISPKPRDFFHGSGHFIDVEPGQVKEMELDLSLLSKFDEVGIYKIIAKYDMWSPRANTSLKVVSNELSISIVPSR